MASCPACGHRPINKNRQGVRACPRHGPITGPRGGPQPEQGEAK